MSEPTALFLADLSHRWFLLLLILSAATGWGIHRLDVIRGRARGGSRLSRLLTLARGAGVGLLVASVGVLGVAFLHVGCAAIMAHRGECREHLRQLSEALAMYAEDYDQHLPPARQWSEAVAPRVSSPFGDAVAGRSGRDPFRCPAAASAASYGMNAELSGCSIADISDPTETVALFDADAPLRSYAGVDATVAWGRHSGAPNVAFVDGHVRAVTPTMRTRLRWLPTDAVRKRATQPPPLPNPRRRKAGLVRKRMERGEPDA